MSCNGTKVKYHHDRENTMKKFRYFATVIVLLLPVPVLAKNSHIKSALSFVGECVRKIDGIEDRAYCDGNIMNLKFDDGYTSFQFGSKEKTEKNRYKESISFVGPGLAKHDVDGKNITYMPVEEITLFDGVRMKTNNQKVKDSVCILRFTGEELKPSDLTYLQCHYKKDGKVTLFIVTDMKMK